MELNPEMNGSPEFAQQHIGKSQSPFGQMSNSQIIQFDTHDSAAAANADAEGHFGLQAIQNKGDPSCSEHPTEHALGELL
jgi:hypothetical protein